MKYIIRIALLLLIGYLGYITFDSVNSDLKYTELVAKKESVIKDRLQLLRDAELLYKDANGKFAANFDDLFKFMETGTMKTVIQEGDRDDSTTVFRSREITFNVKDSLYRDLDIPSLKYVPGNDTAQFIINAGEIKKNGVDVPVFEIKDPYPFSKDRIKANNPLCVGSLFEVNYNGNWK